MTAREKGGRKAETTWEETSLDQDSCAGLAAKTARSPPGRGARRLRLSGLSTPEWLGLLLRDGAGARQGACNDRGTLKQKWTSGRAQDRRRPGAVKV